MSHPNQDVAVIDRDDGPDLDPFDNEEIYEAYSEFLMAQPELHICNGKMLVDAIEQGIGWDEFLQTRREA